MTPSSHHTVPEVARTIGVSEQRVRRVVDRLGLAPQRAGTVRVIPTAAIDIIRGELHRQAGLPQRMEVRPHDPAGDTVPDRIGFVFARSSTGEEAMALMPATTTPYEVARLKALFAAGDMPMALAALAEVGGEVHIVRREGTP